MLSESDRLEILHIIKKFLEINSVIVSKLPEDFTYRKPNLHDSRFVRLVEEIDVEIPIE